MTSEAGDGGGVDVASLVLGQPVDGLYAVARKERLVGRTGRPYLRLDLSDRSGRISATLFDGVADADASVVEGGVARVRGRVGRFRDQPVLELEAATAVEVAEDELARFLPVTPRDRDELLGFFDYLAGEVYDPGLAALLAAFRADAGFVAELRRAPASATGHHAAVGGLLEHTVAVATTCQGLLQQHPWLDGDLLVTAALLHDAGHTRAFTYGAVFGASRAGRLLGHVALGADLIRAHAAEVGAELSEDRLVGLLHCVAAHHDPPPRPLSAEAAALRGANALDGAVASWRAGPPGR